MVVLLEVMGKSGDCAEAAHLKVAREFGLATISLREALLPEIQAATVPGIFYND
jgi:hypothetical protein